MSNDEQAEMKEKVLSARNDGKVVMWVLPDQLMIAPVEQFVRQPAESILWDLNRGEECALSNTGNVRWVNDFAVAITIRELVKQRDAAEAKLASPTTSLRAEEEK